MIKTFEEFVSAKYSKPVNEAFQSSKLRQIIKQHGKPKHSWENNILYDLKDEEIVDVLNSRDEYNEKYSNRDGYEATFMLELEDGSIVVISNLGILDRYWKDIDKLKDDVFKERHAERHKGNLGKFGGDDIHKKHMENVSKLERRRLAEYLQENQKEIVDSVKYLMDKIVVSEWLDGDDTNFSSEMIIDGEEFNIYMYCSVECSDIRKEYGAEYFDAYFTLDHFEIENEDGNFTTNEDLGITEETYKDLFEPIVEKDIEGDIYDYYDYYGVSRSDFY
jgi:hypothetical protein